MDASTLLLSRTPDFCRGRVLATVNGMVRGSSLVAMLLGGLGGTLLGPRTTFVAAGALMALVAVALLVRAHQDAFRWLRAKRRHSFRASERSRASCLTSSQRSSLWSFRQLS